MNVLTQKTEISIAGSEAVENGASDCSTRAQFITLREQLARDWQPCNWIELTLIDSMAQANLMKIFWMYSLPNLLPPGQRTVVCGVPSEPLDVTRIPQFPLFQSSCASADLIWVKTAVMTTAVCPYITMRREKLRKLNRTTQNTMTIGKVPGSRIEHRHYGLHAFYSTCRLEGIADNYRRH